MIIRVYLFVPRWRPVIGRFLVLWHSFNKFVLAKRLHEPAVFNRNHIYIFLLLNIFLFLLLLFCQRTVGCIQSAILPYVYIYIPTYHICRRVFLFLCLWVGYSCFAFFIGDSWRKVSTGEYRVTYRVWSVNLNLLITHWGRLTLAPPTGDGWGCIFFFLLFWSKEEGSQLQAHKLRHQVLDHLRLEFMKRWFSTSIAIAIAIRWKAPGKNRRWTIRSWP